MAAMDLIEAVEENLQATLAVFSRARPQGHSKQLDGVAVASSAIQFSMFNSAILTSPVDSADEFERRVLAAKEHFDRMGLSWSFWLCQGRLARAVRSKVQDVFARYELHFVVELPAMAAESLAPPLRPAPPLVYRRVEDRVTRADFNRIMSIAFGLPFPVSRAIYESERTWDGDFAGWVGYNSNDLPVCSTAVIVTGSVAGVYAVGTLPTHQRKGYAEAVMRHALDCVRQEKGVEQTVLQSSEVGYSLYQKMGYRNITRYAVFASK